MSGSIASILPGAIVQLAPLALLAGCYARRSRTLAGTGQPVPSWRQACFYGGCAMIAVALTGLDTGSQELLALHMVEHLLIGDLAAVLLVLGVTGPLLAPLLRTAVFSRLRVLSNPAIALPLWVADLYVWHLPVTYQAALRHPAVHALQHGMFLACGINLWMCLLGPLPVPSWFDGPRRVVYLLGYWFAGTLLANAFIWIGTAFYPYYAGGDASWHLSALDDQRLAGGAMMIEGSLLTLGIGSWLLMGALRESGERQALVDYARSRGVQLSSERAARAVAAGRTEDLRARVEVAARHGSERGEEPGRSP